jgi:hypothetical protein
VWEEALPALPIWTQQGRDTSRKAVNRLEIDTPQSNDTVNAVITDDQRSCCFVDDTAIGVRKAAGGRPLVGQLSLAEAAGGPCDSEAVAPVRVSSTETC